MDIAVFITLPWEGVYTITQIVFKQAATVVLMPILRDTKKSVEIRKIHFL